MVEDQAGFELDVEGNRAKDHQLNKSVIVWVAF
jgi:hypothetical protein